MEMEYLCARCRKKYPIEEVRYTQTAKGFELICKKCAPDKWKFSSNKKKKE